VCISLCHVVHNTAQNTITTAVLWPFFRDHPGEPVPEENFSTLWCKERLTEADTPTIRLGATPSGLTSAHLHHPIFYRPVRMPFLPPNQQCQSTEQFWMIFRLILQTIIIAPMMSTAFLTLDDVTINSSMWQTCWNRNSFHKSGETGFDTAGYGMFNALLVYHYHYH